MLDRPKPTSLTGADILARALHAAGARRVYGIPGGEVLALIEALDRAGIGVHLARHENAAGFMAEGSWHADGSLPVLFSTLGPGVANAVNVVANAMQDRVPLVFLTGCIDAADAETYTHQLFDHQAVLRPVVKASFRAAAGSVGPMVAKAVAIARDGQPGPVHVDVPIGVAEAMADERERLPIPAAMPVVPASLSALRALLAAAERPLIVAGVDVVNAGAAAELAALADATGAPVITTYKAKGLIDERDPRIVGAAGLSPKADRILLPLVAAADLIVLAGYDPIEMRVGWRNPWPPGTTVIDLAPTLRTHGMHEVTHSAVGDVRAMLAALAEGLQRRPVWPDGRPAALRAELAAAFRPGEAWGPAAVFAALREAAPEDAVVTVDSGAHRILLSQMWQARSPRGLLQSTGLCTMACALPLAIGCKQARPDAPVIAVVGDGGLEMGLGELATLRDLGLPLTIVVMVDASLALIAMKQQATGRGPLAVGIGRTDFAAVAGAFGGHGETVSDAGSFRSALASALRAETFTLIACRIDADAYCDSF
jgi:acetolactate synthase I/II/III large subunit